MELEEIESIYEQKVSEANNFFLKGLTSKENKEKEYKKKLDSARIEYYSRIKRYLSEHKYKREEKKKKAEEKKKKINYNYHKTLWDRIVFNFKLLKFRIKIFLRHIRDLNSVNKLLFFAKKIRVREKHRLSNLKNHLQQNISRAKDTSIKKFNKINEKIKKVSKKIKEKSIQLINFVLNMFHKNKKPDSN